MDPVRVLLDLRGGQASTNGLRGGIHRYVTHLAAELRRRPEVELHALVVADRPLPAVAHALALDGRLHTTAHLEGIAAPFVHHIASPFDVSHDTYRDLAPPSLAVPGCPRVVSAYDAIPLGPWSSAQTSTRQRWEARVALLRSADLVLAISAAAGHEIVRLPGVDGARVRVVGTGVAPSGALPRPAVVGAEPPYVIYTGGTADPRKNVDLLVRAFAVVAQAHPTLRLVIASHVHRERKEALEELARSVGVSERTVVTGWVDDDILFGLIQHALVLAYPSAHEGFGLPIAEAMAHGVPVIATDDPAALDLHGHPEGTAPVGSEALFAVLLGRAVDDPDVRDRLRRWGRSRAATHTWPSVAERTIAAYREVLDHRRPRPRAIRPRQARSPLLATWSRPQLGGPAHAALLLAAGDTGRCLASPIAPALRRLGVRGVASPLLDQVLTDAPRDIIAFPQECRDLEPAAHALRAHDGVLVLWELDIFLHDLSGPRWLTAAADAARVTVLRDEVDRWRLRQVVGHRAALSIVAPPYPWPPPPGLPLAVLAGATAPVPERTERVLLHQPVRFGELTDVALSRAAALAAALPAAVEVRGQLPDEPGPGWIGGHARVLVGAEPATPELLAALRASQVVVAADPDARSACEATIDLALSCGRRVVAAAQGPAHPMVTRLAPDAQLSDLIEAVRVALAEPDDTPDRSHRQPDAVLRALDRLIVDARQ